MSKQVRRYSTRIRTVIAAVMVLALTAIFVVRLADIQVVSAAELNAQAETRIGVTQTLYGSRGDIVDVNGAVLADTVTRWDVTISPRYTVDIPADKSSTGEEIRFDDVLVRLAAITNQNAAALRQRVDDVLAATPNSDYMVLSRGLTVDQFEAVRELRSELGITYLYVQSNPSRAYPDGSVAGNLLGFMGSDETPLAGLEYDQNECLAATNGSRRFEVSSGGGAIIPGSVQVSEPAVEGGTLQLTIDRDVQYQAQQLVAQYTDQLQARYGMMIVMRADGSLVAVAETPTVDPNNPTGVSSEYRGSRVFQNQFEPGSIFKALSMAAMLDLGLVDPGDRLTVPWQFYDKSGVMVQDAHVHPVMNWTAAGAFVNSSNSGLSDMAQNLDRSDYYDYLAGFGLGEQSAIGFPGELSVPLRDPNSLDAQSRLNVLFGQGIAVTPIQMASAYQAFANGGVHQPARLVESCTLADGTVIRPEVPKGERVISEETATTMLELMEHVVTDYGYSTFPIEGYRIAAKTGTAQMPYEDGSGYNPDRMLISTQGVFPVDDPQYIVLTMFDSPQTERTSAGAIPAFHDMVSLLIRHYGIQPSTTEPSEIPLEWP